MVEIKYEYKFQQIAFQETSSYLNTRYNRGALAPFRVTFAIAVVAFPFLLYFKILDVSSESPTLLYAFLILLGFMTAVAIVISVQNKRYVDAIEHAPWRQGTTKATLSENGILTSHASGEQLIR